MNARRPPSAETRPLGRARLLGAACLVAILALGWPATRACALTSEDDVVWGHPASEGALGDVELPSIDASYAALMDEDGTLWFGRGAADEAQIASLTKIMTAIVAAGLLDASATIAVTPEAASVGESSAGLLEGDAMTFDDALKALLTASGNDAASAIAQAAGARLLEGTGLEGDAQACEAAFVDAMNAKAGELDLTGSLFTNPHGLDFDQWAQGQFSCAQDVATLMRAGMGIPLVRANIGFTQVDITVMRGGAPCVLTLANTDALLGSYEGACAAKTGYTLAAGPCVASAVNRGDSHEYYAVVLGSSSKPQRFADAEALYDWVFANRAALEAAEAAVGPHGPEPDTADAGQAPAVETVTYQLVNARRSMDAEIGGVRASHPVVAEVAHRDWTDRTVPATVADPDATATVPADGGAIEQEASFAEVSGDVRCGDVVGRLTFRQGGEVLWESDLLAAADVAAPTWWEALGVGVERFFGGLLGMPETAESELLATGALKVS